MFAYMCHGRDQMPIGTRSNGRSGVYIPILLADRRWPGSGGSQLNCPRSIGYDSDRPGGASRRRPLCRCVVGFRSISNAYVQGVIPDDCGERREYVDPPLVWQGRGGLPLREPPDRRPGNCAHASIPFTQCQRLALQCDEQRAPRYGSRGPAERDRAAAGSAESFEAGLFRSAADGSL